MNKTSLLVAAVLATAAFTAQADELYTPNATPAQGLSRAQVRQSVLDARRTGELNHNDVDQPAPAANAETFGRTRASVKAETLAARANGGLDHDDVDLPNVAKGSVLTRQQVRDDAVAQRHLTRTAPGRNTIDY